MERSQHLHNTERMRKLKILRQKIVAPKKNKMNAGNLGFSQNDGNVRTLFYKGLFWFKTSLDLMDYLSNNLYHL